MNPSSFLSTINKNKTNAEILKRLSEVDIPDTWLVAGSLFQTVWNGLTRRPWDYGIRDYDLFYFDDRDLSWEAENKVVNKIKLMFSDLDVDIEIRNQARVHLWYPEKFDVRYPPLSKTTDGIDRFLARACQVGVKVKLEGKREVYSPNGFEDLYKMLIQPNQCDNFRLAPYLAKAARWKELWPELTIKRS